VLKRLNVNHDATVCPPLNDELPASALNPRNKWTVLRCFHHLIDFFISFRWRKWNLEKKLPIAANELWTWIGCEIGDEIVARIAND
jgi:hypothetical protein